MLDDASSRVVNHGYIVETSTNSMVGFNGKIIKLEMGGFPAKHVSLPKGLQPPINCVKHVDSTIGNQSTKVCAN